jgi:hypothetical protein
LGVQPKCSEDVWLTSRRAETCAISLVAVRHFHRDVAIRKRASPIRAGLRQIQQVGKQRNQFRLVMRSRFGEHRL